MPSYNLVKITLVLLIGFSLGWLTFLYIQSLKPEHKIGYVAKEEILNLEKGRIMSLGETNLFKGKAALSAALINKIGRSLESKDMSVIFTSEKIGGSNIVSLSKKVHEQTIKQLDQLNQEFNDNNSNNREKTKEGKGKILVAPGDVIN